MLNKNASFKKMTNTYKNNISKTKSSGLLLTDFNKYPLVHSKAKTSKKKFYINHQDYNNSLKLKNKRPENDINNDDITDNVNYIYENKGDKKEFKLTNGKNQSQNGKKRINENNNDNKDIKNVYIIDNNIQKHANELMKCNSVNNLIGININVNYMNKNYSIQKLKHNSKKINCDNSCGNIPKNISNINNNHFGQMNNENLDNFSSSKTKLNKKDILILNPTSKDWEKILENLRTKKMKDSKLNINENLKTEKLFQNFIGNNNTSTSTDENNLYSKTNNNFIGKSSSSKNINYIKTQKKKSPANKYIYLYQNMNKKINQLKLKKEKNNHIDYNNNLFKILNEYVIKYSNLLEDHNQKKLIKEIFQQVNKIIKSKEEEIINIRKKNEELLKINKSLKSKNEEIIFYRNNKNELDNSNDKDGSSISNSNNNDDDDDSSSVNSEELESIRFFDKIIMKKNSFSNIPELSFKKINKNNNEKNIDIPNKNNNIIKKYSFQEKNNKNKGNKNWKLNNKYFEIKKKKLNNRNKKNDNSQLLYQKQKIIEKIERNKPNIKSFINIFEKSRNKK